MTNGWVERAEAAARGLGGDRMPTAWLTLAGVATHLLLLDVAAAVSVDEPWGPTRRGRPVGAATTVT